MAFGYNREIADRVCLLVAGGLSLSEACRQEGMPHRQRVHEWIVENHDGFADRYARARDAQLESMADDLLAISDDASNDWMQRNDPENKGWQLNGEHVQRSRLRTDNRRWLLSKLKPDKYGDRVVNQHAGDPDNPIRNVTRLEVVFVRPEN